MTPYVITFIVMVGVFMIGCFAFKLPVGVSMLIAALCGALEGGLGTETIRMMVEGEFGYVDTILTIGCAMIFMKVIPTLVLYRNGKAVDSITAPGSKAEIDRFIQEALAK